jgi:hypothetical protein
MPSRLRERQSSLAVWSVRLAMLSVPVLIIAAIGHRAAMMDAMTTYSVIAVGFSVAGLAVIASVLAFAGIWRDGRKGARTALWGLLVGLLVLSVPAIGAWRVVAYPRLTDIMTDLDDPPQFQAVLAERGTDSRPIADPTDDQADLQRDAYPDLVTRQYPVGTARVFADALALVADRGWRILGQHQPDDQDDSGRIEAVAMTPIFGFRQDVVIRIQSNGDGSLVDMRSAARNGAHDLGADADRIRDFFADLDDSLQGISEQQ